MVRPDYVGGSAALMHMFACQAGCCLSACTAAQNLLSIVLLACTPSMSVPFPAVLDTLHSLPFWLYCTSDIAYAKSLPLGPTYWFHNTDCNFFRGTQHSVDTSYYSTICPYAS